jgi:hypothetical protein
LTDEFYSGQDSPLRRAEALDETMADAGLKPQMSSVTGPFQTPRQQALETGLPAEVRMNSSFAIKLRADDRIPVSADREPVAGAHTEQELISVGAAGRERAFDRTHVQTELARIAPPSPDARSSPLARRRTIAPSHLLTERLQLRILFADQKAQRNEFK